LLRPERIAARIELPRPSAVIVGEDDFRADLRRNWINDVSALVNFMTVSIPFVYGVEVSGHTPCTMLITLAHPKTIEHSMHPVNTLRNFFCVYHVANILFCQGAVSLAEASAS
jgi:hypothetical protein